MKNVALDVKMEALLADFVDQLKALPKRKSGKLMRVPLTTKESAVRLLSSGLSLSTLSERSGVSGNSLRVWQKAATQSGPGRPAAAVLNKRRNSRILPAFNQVQVSDGPVPVSDREGGSVFVLELKGGARVHGLSLEHLRALVLGGV